MEILKFKKVNCKNCYKCIRYCPVKAISIKNNEAQIIEKDCILCGNCTVVCPQNAKEDINDVPKIKALIRDGKNVIASVAPSYVANYSVSDFEELRNALKNLGFSDAAETAEGAYLVKTEYEKLVDSNWNSTIISSCCPTVVKYIQRYIPEAIPYLAPVVSPMQASSKIIKDSNSDATVVFIGPCISKKLDCKQETSSTDYVITFEELASWFKNSNIDFPPKDIPLAEGTNTIDSENEKLIEKYKSRIFPIRGGILDSMSKNPSFNYIAVDGLENCIIALKEVLNGSLHNCFIEMSSCTNSCIGGPHFKKNNLSILSSELSVRNNALNKHHVKDYDIDKTFDLHEYIKSEQIICAEPNKKQILGILKKMGKNSEEDELNCGTCGYSTCREKAIAVYFGKAEISMCLPFMKERAESFSDKIINLTPNSVIAVDMDLKVQQINTSACELFSIKSEKDIIGSPISRILDEFDFINVITTGTARMKKKVFLVEYNMYLEQVFLYDKNSSIVICIMKDITSEKRQKNKLMAEKIKAANMADEIVEKQLRIVHEIASLLGETAAETKVVVNDLKETILMDEDDN